MQGVSTDKDSECPLILGKVKIKIEDTNEDISMDIKEEGISENEESLQTLPTENNSDVKYSGKYFKS